MPSAASVFALASALILPCWVALAVSLFWNKARRTTWLVTGAVVPALFAVGYALLIFTGFAETPRGGFGSITEVRALFASDAALTAGWLHYLAFDLLVGTLIVRKGLGAGIHPLLLLPSLPLTLMFGPLGYLLFLVVRPIAARVSARKD